ncbi:MAG: glycosyltransferase family 2 protein [Deltaproteobacteria bacterium]|nr:glycosyltransferase family 2 protein [Deltaproteobacteria bacterium]
MEARSEKTYDISILVPFYNEEANLEENYNNIKQVIDTLPQRAEIVYVDDGSTDQGLAILKQAARNDPRVKILSFAKNFGQTAAMEAAFKEASGQVYITLDADNQNDPRDIPLLLDKIKEGYDVVSGWRKKRKDAFLMRKLPSIIANWLISTVTGVKLKDYGCTLKAYNAYYLDQVRLYGEMHRFIPAYAKYAGAKVTEVPVNHKPRTKGQSKYGINRTFKVLLDLVTVKFLGEYATKPIYFFGGIGAFFMAVSALVTLFVLYQKLFYTIPVMVHKNPLFVLALFIFMLSVVLIMMGLIAELLMRTYHESQDKKTYRIKEIINFVDKQPETKTPTRV